MRKQWSLFDPGIFIKNFSFSLLQCFGTTQSITFRSITFWIKCICNFNLKFVLFIDISYLFLPTLVSLLPDSWGCDRWDGRWGNSNRVQTNGTLADRRSVKLYPWSLAWVYLKMALKQRRSLLETTVSLFSVFVKIWGVAVWITTCEKFPERKMTLL